MTTRRVRSGELLAVAPGAICQDSAGFFLSFGPEIVPNGTHPDYPDVAMIHIRGSLVHHAGDGGDSYEGILARAQAAVDTAPAGIIVCIDSEGGLVSGLFQAVESLREILRPVRAIAYVNETAASAAYALACAADEIYSPVAASVGSIGTISVLASQAEANRKAGLDVRVLTSGARKSDGHPHVDITDGAALAAMMRVEEMASIFFDLAGEARGLRPTRVRSLQAGVFSGTQAAKLGLTDGVMSLDRVAFALSKGGRQPRAVGVMLNGARAAGPTAGTSAKMGAYSDDQPRDEDGKFGEGGGGHDEHEHDHEHEHHEHEHHEHEHEHEHHEEKKEEEKKDLHVSATRLQWSQRPGRESLRKKLGPAKSFAIEERGGHKCAYCKTPQPKIPPARPLDNHQFDHIIPRVEGGKDHESNLVLACKRCNSARHTMTLPEWRDYAKKKYGVDFSIKAVHEQAARSIDKFLDLFRKRKKG